MAEQTPLDDAEELALERFLKYRDLRTRFELRRLSALATLRLGDVIAGSLDRTDPEQAGHLAALAEREARAYRLLRHVDGVIGLTGSVAAAQLGRLFPPEET
jgi:hypothetical protein